MAEAALWHELRGRRFAGFKFRRQHVLGPFIVDFYCAEAQLILELDGFTHRGKEDDDGRRQAWLEQLGLKVIRCPNHEL
jgi:very-short-patch-repair endonuclease